MNDIGAVTKVPPSYDIGLRSDLDDWLEEETALRYRSAIERLIGVGGSF